MPAPALDVDAQVKWYLVCSVASREVSSRVRACACTKLSVPACSPSCLELTLELSQEIVPAPACLHACRSHSSIECSTRQIYLPRP